MPRRCAFGCTPTTGVRHIFPHPQKFPEQLRAWVTILTGDPEADLEGFNHRIHVVCDRHFIDRDRNRSNRLNALAVPSLFLPEQFVNTPAAEKVILQPSVQSLLPFNEEDISTCPSTEVPAAVENVQSTPLSSQVGAYSHVSKCSSLKILAHDHNYCATSNKVFKSSSLKILAHDHNYCATSNKVFKSSSLKILAHDHNYCATSNKVFKRSSLNYSATSDKVFKRSSLNYCATSDKVFKNHESRSNSRCEDANGTHASEATPLLARFPPPIGEIQRNYTIPILGTILLSVLIIGILIGIYLLMIQNNSENVLPPVDAPALELALRRQWDPDSGYSRQTLTTALTTFVAKQVILVQTDTRECDCFDSCVQLMNEIKVNGTNGFDGIQYNFLVAEYGEVFEGLGWRQPSPLFAEYMTSALVIAVIGNYTHVPPTRLQIQQSENIIVESLSMNRLDPDYVLMGKSVKYYPTHLFKSVDTLPHWSQMDTN